MTTQDKIAAGLISLIQSLLPLLILSGALSLDKDGIAIVMLAVTQAVTFGGLLFQSVQHKSA